MNKTIIAFVLGILPIAVQAQENYSQEEGRVTQYEMTMSEYPADPDAEALVIYDLGNYFFQGDDSEGFLLRMQKRIKIKILKQSGIKHASFEIPYYREDNKWERIESIEATTYNLSGDQLTTTALESKNIFEEKINETSYVKKIALPDVREGSVVELKYTLCTPFFFNMRKWYFQRKIPVVYSRLSYKAIPYYAYTYILKGTNKFDEFSSEQLNNEVRFGNLKYREILYHFGMKNIPAFKDEEFITSEENYLINLNFQMSQLFFPRGGKKQIMTTWPEMSDDFIRNDDFGKYVKSSEKEAKNILPGLNLEGKTEEQQLEAIADYVKTTYKWNDYYGKFAQLSLKNFLAQKTGNVGNINLFLTGLLRAAGMDAYPVILSTRKNGDISVDHPFQQFFNYVIVLVKTEKKLFLIDGTEPLLYFSEIPERCINVLGLVIKPKSEEWVNTAQKMKSTIQRNYTLNILPDENSAEVNALYVHGGESAYKMRTVYRDQQENLEKHLKDRNNIESKNMKISAPKKAGRPFSYAFEFSAGIEANAGKLFVQPFCQLTISSNPFKQATRTLPVDLVYYHEEIYSSTIDIPEGYEVEYLPSNLEENNDLMSVKYIVNNANGKIITQASYFLKKNIYAPEEYNELKEGFNRMIKAFSEMIVLVKKQ